VNAESTGLRRISLAATLCLTSHAEYAAGVASGLPLWHPWGNGGHAGLAIGLPWLLPVAIDCYVVDALERRNGMDRWAALGILALSVIGGSAYVAADMTEAVKAAGVGVVLVLVLARLYAKAKPSKADTKAADIARTEREAEEARRVHLEQDRERAAARLRIEEAEHLARIDAERARAEADATAAAIRAEAEAEIGRSEAARTAAEAEAERLRAASEADIALLNAQAEADIARIHAEAEAKRAARTPKATRKRTPPPGQADIEEDIADPTGEDLEVDTHVIPFAGQQGRLVSAVLAGKLTHAAAADRANVSTKTISRWVKAARAAQDTQTAVNG